MNIRMRGAIVDSYETPERYYHDQIPTNYITKTKNNYVFGRSGSKGYKLTLESSTTQNRLNGTSINRHFQYDIYTNPKKETVNYSGYGSTVTDIQYANSTGSTYYIGRPTKKIVTATINAKSFTTEERYGYTGYLMTQKQYKGDGTQFNTETYSHDIFGNATGISTTPYGETARTVSFKYDTTGRFMTESTDVEGLKDSFGYNIYTGTLSIETDAHNRTTRYLHDAWNRLIEATDYLGNSAKTTYTESSTNYYTISTSSPDGAATSTTYDPLKRKVNERIKGLGGAWSQVSYKYDALDRLSGQSEPHTGSTANQWNTTSYDLYGRVTSMTSFTGRTVTYSYSGLTATVNDGVKTTTSTLDAMGNTRRVDDPGGSVFYSYGYDSYKRLNKIVEAIPSGKRFIKEIGYDQYGRISQEKYEAKIGSYISDASISHTYDAHGVYNGYSGYRIRKTNARGQVTEAYGVGNKVTNEYDSNGYIRKTLVDTFSPDNQIIENTYSFNAQRGTLTSREQMTKAAGHHKTYAQNFIYDDLDRLTQSRGAFNRYYNYDATGRMTRNSHVGQYNYLGGSKKYQLKDIDVYEIFEDEFIEKSPRTMAHNAFGKPVNIEVDRGGRYDRVAFQYGPLKNRTDAWYGGGHPDKNELRYHKFYSSIAPIEVVHDKNNDEYKFVFFLGGDAYSAKTARVETFKNGQNNLQTGYFFKGIFRAAS